MPRQLGPGGTQLPRHMGPPGPKMGGDPHACDTGTLFATKIVPPGTLLVAKSVPALPKVYRVVRKYR